MIVNINCKPENPFVVRQGGVAINSIRSQAFLLVNNMSRFKRASGISLCSCGCGQEVKKSQNYKGWNKFILGHGRRTGKFFIRPKSEAPLCLCGCGEKTKWNSNFCDWNKYLHSHIWIGRKHTEKTKQKLSQIRIGKIPWNKKKNDKEIEKLKKQKPPLCSCGCGEFVKWNYRRDSWNIYLIGHQIKNKKQKEETKRKISKAGLGNQRARGYKQSEKQKAKRSQDMLNGQAAYTCSFNQNPSKPQVELFELIKQLYPNAILNYPSLNFSIDIAIPDQNIAIEYDCWYWHDEEKDKIRQKLLESIGWTFLRYRDYVPKMDELKSDLQQTGDNQHGK